MCDRPPGYKLPIWHRRGRWLVLAGAILIGSALILRKTLGTAAVENSWMYWLQPFGTVLMIIAGVTVICASEKPFSEPKGLSDASSQLEEGKDADP